MFLLYDLIFIIFALFYFPYFLFRRKGHRDFCMRLGIFPPDMVKKLKDKKVIWLQAVSVGEAAAAGKLWELLRREYPDYQLALSTTTKTGNRIARKIAASQDIVLYFPLDLSFIVRRVINQINPRLFLTVETEIWPNLIRGLFRRLVPIALVNGRISRRSFSNYKKVKWLFKGILQKADLFCMQTETDAARIISLGAPRERVHVTGNMKFDCALPVINQQLPDLGLEPGEKLFIAGSTHKGEEKIILRLYKNLLDRYPRVLRLLIAPRHIERVGQIEKIIARHGFGSVRASQLPVSRHQSSVKINDRRLVYILDSIGQLAGIYSRADIVFVGGSLASRGGHNLIEPAMFGKAVLFGPYTFNFRDIAELFLKCKAGIRVKNARELESVCDRLLSATQERITLGERAKKLIAENKGASERNLELIKNLINPEVSG